IRFRYIENESNLGYDRNLRKCIELCEASWAIIMGNDDLLLPNATSVVWDYVSSNDVDFVSRAFIRFGRSLSNSLGISSLSSTDVIFSAENAKPRMIFRAAGFVGGLIVKTDFAR